MGTRGREIIGMDVDKLLHILNRAYCDEWFAYYQYWLGAKVVQGAMKDAVAAELLQHATEELGHAEMVAERILQLGGTPATEPSKWYELTNCGYDAPNDPAVTVILEQNIKGEQCAISVYRAMMDEVREADPVTYDMALKILEQEVEHEEDLQSLQEDLDMLKQDLRKLIAG
jgi:bacterioferritin